ncbi:MAG TPA: bifunctional demethylmenaquinone methyltransferase/2-methoxy-6-polyprenyl-1,4-benzoquinol methylase UbiE [Thermoanaerobaculia bacterium]
MTNYTGPDPAKIRTMFAAISRRYDRANTVMSAGVHHLWRSKAVKRAGVRPGDRVLDCATGTGDLAIAFRKAVGDSGRVVGTDFVPEMLEVARVKAQNIEWEVADVTQLPFETGSFDVASISFGIRNVGEPRKGIAEMARAVRSGGRVIVLEFGQPQGRAFGALYNWYSQHILPRLGGAVTGDEAAYRYLQTSSERFPCADDFVALMRESAEFASVDFVPLTFGIAYLYRGVKK